MEITCRSPEQIRDDALVQLHTDLTRALNAVSGGRCLYVNDQRAHLKDVLERVEDAILSGAHVDTFALTLAFSHGLCTHLWGSNGQRHYQKGEQS